MARTFRLARAVQELPNACAFPVMEIEIRGSSKMVRWEPASPVAKGGGPHQVTPLCLGSVTGTTLPSKPGEYVWGMDGQVLRCPWHGWEFDLNTGGGLYDPYHHERVATYDVKVEDGEVMVYA